MHVFLVSDIDLYLLHDVWPKITGTTEYLHKI